MHVASIKRIAVDRACRIAVTGSDDKTGGCGRCRSAPSAHLARADRTRQRRQDRCGGHSPDGHWIAAGGWDAQVNSTTNFDYIFEASNRAHGGACRTIRQRHQHLAFSSDGRWLAANSHADVGIKVIDAQTWKIAFEDKDYKGDSYGGVFAADGRLYTVAFDGKLRRYGPGPEFKKLHG